MMTTKRGNHAIFIEGLPLECVETDLIKLLQPCGKVNAVSIQRQPTTAALAMRPQALSATVEFQNREHAEAAVYLLETSVVWGRRLSARLVSAASQGSAQQAVGPSGSKALRSAQVHVSYLTKQLTTIVTEEMILELFSTFGKVMEVSLKKKCVDTEMCIQNGYGFVHFALSNDGIESALRAVETLHQVTINNISYDCSISNQLKQLLVATGRVRDNGSSTNTPAPSSAINSQIRPTHVDSILGNSTANRSWWEESESQAKIGAEDRLPGLFQQSNQLPRGSQQRPQQQQSIFPPLSSYPLHGQSQQPAAEGLFFSQPSFGLSPYSEHRNAQQQDAASISRMSSNSFTSGHTSGHASFAGSNSSSDAYSYHSGSFRQSAFPSQDHVQAGDFNFSSNISRGSGGPVVGLSGGSVRSAGSGNTGTSRSKHSMHSSISGGEESKRSQRQYHVSNAPLIAEDDNFAYTGASDGSTLSFPPPLQQSSSSRLPGVFNKWF